MAGVFSVGDWCVDPALRSLTNGSRDVHLEPKVMQVLLALASHQGQVVTRDVLFQTVWPDTFVSDEVLSRTISELRRALGDDPRTPRYIQTIPKGGYRFVASVTSHERVAAAVDSPAGSASDAQPRHALGDSHESPGIVETVPGKGHRFVGRIEVVARSPARVSPATADGRPQARRHNLPAELTSFIGRQQELLDLPGVLASSRLLSLTGAGGVGKTRLAVQLARSVVDRFADGVWFVDLAPLSRPDLVAQVIATSLGIQEGAQRSARDTLLDTVRDRELLLVLDNCEHLVTRCAEIAGTLVRGAPALRIVVTSREALRVPGEAVYRVPALSLPDPLAATCVPALVAGEATRLFIERARAVDSGFTITPENAAAIGSICRRLDGIPLAIELAAARVLVLSPGQIEARLQDRFRLLTGGGRTDMPRQRTLEATLDWSYRLLSDSERRLLSRLSVFPAAWALAAAEDVCSGDGVDRDEVLDVLSRLVGKSLVTVEGDVAGERRYRLLETVRQYAEERLREAGSIDPLRDRHFAFFFEEYRGVLAILSHHGQLACLRRLRVEQENIRAALDWGLKSAALAAKGVELAGALFWFWTKCGLFEEGSKWLEQALAVNVTVPASVRARALIGLANLRWFQGRHVDANACAAEALSLGRSQRDAWVMSFALFLQATAAFERGDRDEATARSLEARVAADAGGEQVLHGPPLLVLGSVAASNGDRVEAQRLYDESIDVLRRAGESWGMSIVLLLAAGLRILGEDYVRARAQVSEALSVCQEFEDPRGVAWGLEIVADLLAAGGRADGAARLWGASERQLENIGGSLSSSIGWVRERCIEPARALLGAGPFETARAEGRTMRPEQAIALARQELHVLGDRT